MNDQSQIMNQPPQVMNPVQSQIMSQNAQVLSQAQMLSQSQAMAVMNQPPPPQVMNPVQSQIMSQTQMMAQSQAMNAPLMFNRSYKPWSQQDPSKKFMNSSKPNFVPNFVPSKPRSNWNKGKKVSTDNMKRKDSRRNDVSLPGNMANSAVLSGGPSGVGGTGGYKPPTLHELQSQNRLRARKFYPKKKFNNSSRFKPYAPRNTTSFIIRAKKDGGITSLVSPCPVTPAVLPTPIFSPSREVLGDMAKEEWGVDGYGSMKGLIRLRASPEEEEEENGSSESDVEEHVEVERRLNHDLSRFEMIYPNYGGVEYNNVLENRVDDQDTHIAQLEEENLTLKERLFLMERELGDLRRRLQFLERQSQGMEDVNEEVVENGSENESDGGSDVRAANNDDENNNDENMGDVSRNDEQRSVNDVCMEDFEPNDEDIVKEEDASIQKVGNHVIAKNNEHGEESTKGIAEDNAFKRKEAVNEIVHEVICEELDKGIAKRDVIQSEEVVTEVGVQDDLVAEKVESKDELCV